MLYETVKKSIELFREKKFENIQYLLLKKNSTLLHQHKKSDEKNAIC